MNSNWTPKERNHEQRGAWGGKKKLLPVVHIAVCCPLRDRNGNANLKSGPRFR